MQEEDGQTQEACHRRAAAGVDTLPIVQSSPWNSSVAVNACSLPLPSSKRVHFARPFC